LRERRETELPEVEIAAFKGKIPAELVSAEELVPGAAVAVGDRGHGEAAAQQASGNPRVVDGRSRLADVGPDVPAGIVRPCNRTGDGGDCDETQRH